MYEWILLTVGSTLIAMWLLGKILPAFLGKEADATRSREGQKQALSWIELVTLAMALAIGISISVPTYQNYSDRSYHLVGRVDPVVELRMDIQNLRAESDISEASVYLKQAQDELDDYAELTDSGTTTSEREEMVSHLHTAEVKIQRASLAEPSPVRKIAYRRVLGDISELQKNTELGDVEVTGASLRPAYWKIGLAGAAVLFLLTAIGVTVFVAHTHRNGSPSVAKRWIRTLLEPIASAFAILLGLGLTFSPGVDPIAAQSGAGLAGLGVGFWLNSR